MFGVLRWVVIVVLVVVTLFPFYYMVVLSLRSLDEVVLRPRRCCGRPSSTGAPTCRCSSPRTTAARASWCSCATARSSRVLTVVFTLLAAIPGAYAISRLEFFGRRQVSALFLAVYLFPAILLAVPLFVFFSAIGLRGSLVGLVVVYVAQTVPLSIYMLRNYFETVPVSPGGGRGHGRGVALDDPPPDQPAAGDAGGRLERPVRVHDRLERVPVRAAVPGREPPAVDGVARAWPSSPAASRSRPRC